MYSLPISIESGGKEFRIREKGDFRLILDCFNALNDEELVEQERLISCLIIFYENFESFIDVITLSDDELADLVKKMYNFFNCGQDHIGKELNYRLIDWDRDSQLVSAAVNKVSGFEIRNIDYLHWWTFMGYYLSVGESALSTIVSIRDKIKKGKKLEKYEQEFRNENPQYFNWDSRTIQEREDDYIIKNLWNST